MSRGLVLALLASFSSLGALGHSQDTDVVQHVAAPCMDTEEFPLIEARAVSPETARRLRDLVVRFKAESDTDWYEVSFPRTTGTLYQVALPKPLPTAARVQYYIASGDQEFRSPEYFVSVLMGGCPGARTAPANLSNDIRVRRTSEGQSEIPDGFSADGIRTGGSMSAATLGIVAAAGAGAGVAALVITGDEPPPDGGGSTPGNPEAIRACFTPDPIPDIDSGESILFDASCTTPSSVTTYQWNFGDLTTAQGSSVEHIFRPGGVYTVTLSASDGQRTDTISRVVRVIATPSACFITNPDPPRIAANESINFNAECSEGDRDGGAAAITRYEWDFGDGRPGTEGIFVSRQFAQPDVYGVRLTVTNEDGRQGANTQFIVVENRTSDGDSLRTGTGVAFTSYLEFPEGNEGIRAQVSLNDSETTTTTAGSASRHRLHARAGENVIEARLLSEASQPGRWRFDFSGDRSFVAGSLRVDAGQVLVMDSHSVVFRLSGKPGPLVRFRFRISP